MDCSELSDPGGDGGADLGVRTLQVVAATVDPVMGDRAGNGRGGRFEFLRGTELIAGYGHEETGHGQVRQMLGPELLGLLRRVERIADEHQPSGRQPFGDGHGAHPAAHGPSAEQEAIGIDAPVGHPGDGVLDDGGELEELAEADALVGDGDLGVTHPFRIGAGPAPGEWPRVPGMRTLGVLGGMSWTSTESYYRLLNEGVAARLGGLHSAQLLLHSVDFDPVARAQHDGDWDATLAILSEAGLSYLGLGPSGSITWGTMLNQASQHNAFHIGAWWWFVPPGLMIALLGCGLSLINFSIDETINPKLRSAPDAVRSVRRAEREARKARRSGAAPEDSTTASTEEKAA